MAKPSTRQGLIDYALRKLGAPVLEINIDDDQIDDLVDDAIQLFNERHFDGVERMYLKYRFTQNDIDRGKAHNQDGSTNTVGLAATTGTSTNIIGYGTTTSQFVETSNFIQVPESVIGIEKIFKFDTSSISGGMFSIKYQLFLNDLYYFNSVELLQYSMVKMYLVALMKRQWGQNLIKFRGVKLPGGLELNGREIYEDGERELEAIKQKMQLEYELPPFDFIG